MQNYRNIRIYSSTKTQEPNKKCGNWRAIGLFASANVLWEELIIGNFDRLPNTDRMSCMNAEYFFRLRIFCFFSSSYSTVILHIWSIKSHENAVMIRDSSVNNVDTKIIFRNIRKHVVNARSRTSGNSNRTENKRLVSIAVHKINKPMIFEFCCQKVDVNIATKNDRLILW